MRRSCMFNIRSREVDQQYPTIKVSHCFGKKISKHGDSSMIFPCQAGCFPPNTAAAKTPNGSPDSFSAEVPGSRSSRSCFLLGPRPYFGGVGSPLAMDLKFSSFFIHLSNWKLGKIGWDPIGKSRFYPLICGHLLISLWVSRSCYAPDWPSTSCFFCAPRLPRRSLLVIVIESWGTRDDHL